MAKLAPVLLLMLLTPTASLMAQESAGYETHRFDDGSVLLHYPDAGVLARGDANGKVVAQAKVSRRGVITAVLEVLLSPDRKRVLLIFTGDDATAPAPHRLIVLNATTLRTDFTLRIGPCVDATALRDARLAHGRAVLRARAQPGRQVTEARASSRDVGYRIWTAGSLAAAQRHTPRGLVGPMLFGNSDNVYPKPAAVSNLPCPD